MTENPSLGLPMFHSPSTQPGGLPASPEPVSGKSGWDPGSLDPGLSFSPLLSIASLYRPNCCLVATNGHFVGNSLRTIHLSQAEVKLIYCKVSSVCLVWFGFSAGGLESYWTWDIAFPVSRYTMI